MAADDILCSSILHTAEVSETGLWFYVDILLHFVKIANISLAVLHNEGVVPVVSDVLNIGPIILSVKIGTISSAHSMGI